MFLAEKPAHCLMQDEGLSPRLHPLLNKPRLQKPHTKFQPSLYAPGEQVKETETQGRGSPRPQPTASLASCIPCSHVVPVPAVVHHNLLHTHELLGAIVLAQVVISNGHTESHLAGEREGSLRDLLPPWRKGRKWVTAYLELSLSGLDRGGQKASKVRIQQAPSFPEVIHSWQQKIQSLHIFSSSRYQCRLNMMVLDDA